MTKRLEIRVERLEGAAGLGNYVPAAVVRYAPPDAAGWLPDMFERLGWPASKLALVTIDGRAEQGAAPEVLVPPVQEDRLTPEQLATLAHAGRGAGDWWIAIAGRGWADAIPMPKGEADLLADLRHQRDRNRWGHAGEF